MTQRAYRAECRVPRNGSVEIRAALTYPGGVEFLRREEVATMRIEIWKLGLKPDRIQTLPLIVDDVLIDGPLYHEQDPAWEYKEGYNFRSQIPSNMLTDAPARYRLVLKIQLLDTRFDAKVFDVETWSEAGHA